MKENKGTITWLPIEGAPKDGTTVLIRQDTILGIMYYIARFVSPAIVGDAWTTGGVDNMNPKFITHFAYINELGEDE